MAENREDTEAEEDEKERKDSIFETPSMEPQNLHRTSSSEQPSGNSLHERLSLGPYIQMAISNPQLLRRRSVTRGRSSNQKLSISQLINPAAALFNHSIKAGVQKFLIRHVTALAEAGKITQEPINDILDVDFVFIVNKNEGRSMGFRCANWLSQTFGRGVVSDTDIQTARHRYLEGLKNTYKISYTKISTQDFDFYPLKLSFYHLGLLMQLCGYQWRIRSNNEAKVAYKTFYFLKRDVERYHEYHKCRSRQDFSARWRYDLAYHCLVGAHIPVANINPWKNLLKRGSQPSLDKTEKGDEEDAENTPVKEKGYSLLQLFVDEIFDDWLVPHVPVRERTDEDVTGVIEDINETGTSKERCCANCCFPCWTCQMKEAKENSLSEKSDADSACGSEFINEWRSFCFRNAVDCMDITQRPSENEREFLGRISTVRNSVSKHTYPSPMEETPAKIRHILPLKTLVDYLGEKIGFYFGWVELFVLSLAIPSILGTCMFFAGVAYYTWSLLWEVDPSLVPRDKLQWILAKACDNYATPVFSAVMVIWGTTFYELWQRREKWYSYLWHVEKLEYSELERPPAYSFKVTKKLRDSSVFAPLLYFPSFIITLFFIILVFVSVYFVNVVNVFSVPYCPKPITENNTLIAAATNTPMNPVTTMASNITSEATGYVSVMQAASSTTPENKVDYFVCNLFSAAQVIGNSISMFVLDFIYTRICYLLTDWEGHRTQSKYTNALVLKLFTFRFFNYYSVLFYIAFGIATHTAKYPDSLTGGTHYDYDSFGCGEQPCMAMLSRQLLSVIVTQPLINSLSDVIVPGLKLIYVSIKNHSKTDRAISPEHGRGISNEGTEIDDASSIKNSDRVSSSRSTESRQQDAKLAAELEKQAHLSQLSTLDRREFTTEEYTEKVIVYGALLLFSVALPPAPALAILIMRIDLNLDIGRIMNEFRRPIPLRSQNIGMWGPILNFLTYLGIVTNPLIVILTSSWGSNLTVTERFLIFLIFEHTVFAIRMLVSFAVPDVPKSLVRQQLIHKSVKDELQSNLLDAKIEQAGANATKKNRYRQNSNQSSTVEMNGSQNRGKLTPLRETGTDDVFSTE